MSAPTSTADLFTVDTDRWIGWRARDPEAAEQCLAWVEHLIGRRNWVRKVTLGEGFVDVETLSFIRGKGLSRQPMWDAADPMTLTVRYLVSTLPPAWPGFT